MAEETTLIAPEDICRHGGWNSRQDHTESGNPTDVGQRLTHTELVKSIRETGLLQQIGVVEWSSPCEECGNTCRLVWGYRRHRALLELAPAEPIHARVRAVDSLGARIENLTENLHRRDLRPYEIADALAKIKEEDPDTTIAELSTVVGLDHRYVANLLRFRRKIHPDIWDQFRRFGTSIRVSFPRLLEICMLPKEEQVEAYKQAIQPKAAGHGKRGRQQRPGQKKLVRYLDEVSERYPRESDDFKRGMRKGLRIALGDARPKHKRKPKT